MFEFFRIWILVVAAGMAVAGGVAVLIVGTPVFAVVARLLDRPFWPARPDARTLSFQSWAYSVTFAVMAGWGLCMAIVVANAFSARAPWVWWSIAAPLAVWFPLDTGRSVYHRVWVNVALNTTILVLLAIPLIATFGEFR
jgi:hypothetical protein